MVTSATASPLAANYSVWFRRDRVPLYSAFPYGLPSPFRKPFSLTATFNQNEKIGISSIKAYESHTPDGDSLPTVTFKVPSASETDLTMVLSRNTKSLGLGTSTLDDVASVQNQSPTSEHIVKSDPRVSAKARPLTKERNPARLSSSAAQINDLGYLPVIKYPIVTESAMKQMVENNTLTFIVDVRANKTNIKDTVKKLFKATAKKVNTLILPGGSKKAYVVMAPDCKAVDLAKKIGIL